MAEYRYIVDDSDMIKALDRFKSKAAKYIHLALNDSLTEVGETAVGAFMRTTPGPHDGILGMRTTRLMRSIKGTFSFAGGASGEKEGIREINVSSVGDFSAKLGSRVPYAAAHEFGYPPRNLPARPYLNPALNASKDNILMIFNKRLEQLIKDTGNK